MIRIAVNGKSLGIQEKGGAVRVALRLLTELARQYPDLTLEIFLPISNPATIASLALPTHVIVHRQCCQLFRYGIVRTLWEQCIFPLWLRCHPPFDLLIHLTNTAPALQLCAIPEILLLHDIGFLNTDWFSRGFGTYVKWSLDCAIRRGVHLVTVSQASAEQIYAAFPALASPIQVIWNGVDPPPAQIAPPPLSQDYILFIGSQNPRKNLQGVIAGYNLFRVQNGSDLHLVIVGAQKTIFSHLPNIQQAAADITVLGYVEESLKWSLLKHAKLLLLPSFMEGFGLPIAEALMMGIPAVVSDIPVFHELFDPAVEYVNPHSPQDIARGIAAIVHRQPLAGVGTRHNNCVKPLFLWSHTAAQYFELFQVVRRSEGNR
jgi:glycosyltransferase involved in cell wall biosynthesis